MVQAAAAPTHALPFFPVSVGKLLIMSLCTFGIYQFFWFYKNWQHVRLRTGAEISPFWRTFFFFVFARSLFARVNDADPRGAQLPVTTLAVVWVVVAIVVTPAMVFASLPVQRAINAANAAAAPGHDRNARFSIWNWLAILVGGWLSILTIYAISAGDVVITP
jgi:hypothetical protein